MSLKLNAGDIIDISEPYPWDGLIVWQVMNDKCLASFEYFCETEQRDKVEMVIVSIEDIDGYMSACGSYKAYKQDDSQWFVSLLGAEGIIDATCFKDAINHIIKLESI